MRDVAEGVVYILPWPPSVNGYWRTFTAGSRRCQILSQKAREFRWSAALAMGEQGLPWRLASGPVAVVIYLIPATNRRYDVDNFSKAVLDVLKGRVYEDDSQIVRQDVCKLGKLPQYPHGAAIVGVREIHPSTSSSISKEAKHGNV